MIARKIGCNKNSIVFGSYPPGYPYRPPIYDQPYIVLDSNKIKEEPNWTPEVSLREGLDHQALEDQDVQPQLSFRLTSG